MSNTEFKIHVRVVYCLKLVLAGTSLEVCHGT